MALYTHVAALLVGAAVAGVAGWTARGWKAAADEAGMRETAEETRRLRESASQRHAQRIDRENTQRAARDRALDDRDRDELERLRIAAASRNAQPDTPSCGPVEESFRECRAALERGAGMVVRGTRLVREVGRAHEGLRSDDAEVGERHLSPDR